MQFKQIYLSEHNSPTGEQMGRPSIHYLSIYQIKNGCFKLNDTLQTPSSS